MTKPVKIKVFDTWYDAIMEQTFFQSTGEKKDKEIRKYHLYKPMDEEDMVAFMENAFNEIECDDGYKVAVYMVSELTLIEKDARNLYNAKNVRTESEKVLVTKRIYDGEADRQFEETYLFDKSHAKAVFTETLPLISDFFFSIFGRKDTVTHTLWLTRNGGFVWEEEFSSGNMEYSIIEKSEAENIIKERSEEKYIEIFHPKEI